MNLVKKVLYLPFARSFLITLSCKMKLDANL